jgi:hypothetical protein
MSKQERSAAANTVRHSGSPSACARARSSTSPNPDFSQYDEATVKYAKENGWEDGLIGLSSEPVKVVDPKDYVLDVNHPKFREVEPAMAKGGQVGNQCASKNESRDHAIRFTPTELAQQLGQQLAKFREVKPAMTKGAPSSTPVPVGEYVLDANSTEFREVLAELQQAVKGKPGACPAGA